MVEKIDIFRDEVLHYPWLDHTWVYVHYGKNEVTSSPMFLRLLAALFKYGIKETTGKAFDDVENNGYLFIKYDTDEIIPILRSACDWLLNCGLMVKDPTTQKGRFFEEHKEIFFTFLRETKQILEEKKYNYYYQSVDGMN